MSIHIYRQQTQLIYLNLKSEPLGTHENIKCVATTLVQKAKIYPFLSHFRRELCTGLRTTHWQELFTLEKVGYTEILKE